MTGLRIALYQPSRPKNYWRWNHTHWTALWHESIKGRRITRSIEDNSKREFMLQRNFVITVSLPRLGVACCGLWPFKLSRTWNEHINMRDLEESWHLIWPDTTVETVGPQTNTSPELHHVFQDQHGFEYKVVLTRINILQPNKPEKYTLYVRSPSPATISRD